MYASGARLIQCHERYRLRNSLLVPASRPSTPRGTGGDAPNRPEPLDVCYDMSGRGKREGAEFFDHAVLAERYDPRSITREFAQGGHFFNSGTPSNDPKLSPRLPLAPLAGRGPG